MAQKINGRPNKFTTFLYKLLCLIQKTAQIELAFKIFAELTVVLLEPAKAAMTRPLVQARMRAKKNGVT